MRDINTILPPSFLFCSHNAPNQIYSFCSSSLSFLNWDYRFPLKSPSFLFFFSFLSPNWSFIPMILLGSSSFYSSQSTESPSSTNYYTTTKIEDLWVFVIALISSESYQSSLPHLMLSLSLHVAICPSKGKIQQDSTLFIPILYTLPLSVSSLFNLQILWDFICNFWYSLLLNWVTFEIEMRKEMGHIM